MNDSLKHGVSLPPEQQAIRDKCFHPSGTFVEFPQEEIEQSIPERIEKIVRQYPSRPAIESESELLTYEQLNRRANGLAQEIFTARGDQSEPIGLLLGMGASLTVAMLAVSKVGKFFFLLDPSFPRTRLRAIIEDSQANLVITDARNVLLGRQIAGASCQLLEVDSADDGACDTSPRLRISAKTLAALCYTSGSTGVPKGVLWNQQNILHHAMLFTNAFHLCADDRLGFLAAGTASAAVHPFIALLIGATYLPFDVRKRGIAQLATWLARDKITVCSISSPLFRSFVATLSSIEHFPDLRLMRLSSEAAYKRDHDLFKQSFPPTCLLANGIGPTETGLLRTYLVDHDANIAEVEVPLGYALPDKEILLLDGEGNEVGFDKVGEITVRSRYLSPGYWRAPELTKAKFRPDSNDTGKQIYRTGDLALIHPDGCLVYKGRKDFRIKIRGYGVEIADVEKSLLEHRAIKETVVVPRQNELGETYLAAYFTSRQERGPTVRQLREFLSQSLPDYYIPSCFVRLDSLPLTPNGKIDRGALPPSEQSRLQLGTEYAAPRGSTQLQLAAIWTEVLSVQRVGIHDNFFDLGGHSLSAMRVIARVRDCLRIEIPVSHFFEHPTIMALSGFLESADQMTPHLKCVPSEHSSKAQGLPLSFGQQRLWFLDQLEPDNRSYNLLSAYRVRGRLDAAILERSVNEIVRRHESLRTVFRTVNGEPRQFILPWLTLKVRRVDFQDVLTDTDYESQVQGVCSAEAQHRFDLSNGPFFRVIILRRSETEHVLLFVIHHIAFDGWSMEVFARELSLLYRAFSDSNPSPLEPLAVQYADFARRQRESMAGNALDTHIRYWRQQLMGTPTLQLQTDRPRPSVQSSNGQRVWFELPETLGQSLKSLSRQESSTLFMTLLSAYQILLHRYSAQDDIAVGTPVAGRSETSFEGLIGFFLNTLVLRSELSGNLTFREVLARTRKICVEAYAHQDLPFEKLVEELRIERDLSRNPLFQVSFGFRNTPISQLEFGGAPAKELDIDPQTVRFDIELFIGERDSSLHGFLAYNTDLFDAATIERMVGHFQILLDGIVANPDRKISELGLLTKSERRQLLIEWNDTASEYSKDKCVHQLFEEQVVHTPDAIAIVSENKQLSFKQLNQRANQLAHYLRKLRVKPETLVGLCVERSLDMVIAMLGILKAGGAYVPIDPSYPVERQAFMLKDAQPSVLVAEQKLFGGAQHSELSTEISKVWLDRDWELVSQQSNENLDNTANPDNLAYVLYTSGSTGRPKGVAVEHRNTVAFLSWVRSVFTPADLHGVLAATSICFDLSVFEIFASLIFGGKVILAKDALALSQLGAATEVTLINTVPSAMNELVRISAIPHSVRVVNLAGEPLRSNLVQQIYESTSVRKVYDLYGPTECTTYSTWARRRPDGPQTVGRPIANTQIYILDQYLVPVPIGVIGEIYLGGNGLARGYLNQPELTAEKFIYHSFSGESAKRLYKTGDLARYLPDGNIEFLGRMDTQVKIRGYRIELGEIEAVLGQHRAVQSSVVVVREDEPGDKRLVGYVVARTEESLDAAEVRKYLKQKLPEYMIPSALVRLDELPLTPSGKVDRRALPAPDQNRPELEDVYQAPRTSIEATLASIWAELLKVDKVGIHDNFFELGGHSLLATQLVSRIRSTFSIELPLRHLFESPTVAEMAVIITESQAKRASDAELAQMLREVEAITEEEAQKLLAI